MNDHTGGSGSDINPEVVENEMESAVESLRDRIEELKHVEVFEKNLVDDLSSSKNP